MSARKNLTEAEILQIIEGWTDSEDEFFEDKNNNDCIINEDEDGEIQTYRYKVRRIDEEEDCIIQATDISNMPIDFVDTTVQIEVIDQTKPASASTDKILWRCRDFTKDPEEIIFRGDESLPDDFPELCTPYACFKFFFDEDLINLIISESNSYVCQKNINNTKCITELELRKFLGICILMSVIQIPNYRRYWSPIAGNQLIQETMSLPNFERIKSLLHFNDNEKMLPTNHPEFDRLYKIRPVIESLQKNFRKVPLESSLSVDEQLCSTKCKSAIKQYLPNKPHKWGFKLFVLSGISGFSYNFEVYTGQENDPRKRLPSEKDLGASANVVIRMLRYVPRSLNYRVYFDNYYSSVPLVVELSKGGILCLGTIRRNRIPNCKLPTEKEMKKDKRGTSVEYTAKVDDIELTTVVWKDNHLVTLISNFVGRNPIQSSERYDKKAKSRIEIECPNVIKEYNRYMGGVDLLDSYIGRYKVLLRSKKWYMRIFFHLLDMSVVNSWLIYRRIQLKHNSDPKEILNLADFRLQLGEILCKYQQKKLQVDDHQM